MLQIERNSFAFIGQKRLLRCKFPVGLVPKKDTPKRHQQVSKPILW